MTNLEKYKNAFAEAFEAELDSVEAYEFGKTQGWDSIGHMSLVAALEDAFGIELEPEEILEIRSFDSGKELLQRRGVEF